MGRVVQAGRVTHLQVPRVGSRRVLRYSRSCRRITALEEPSLPCAGTPEGVCRASVVSQTIKNPPARRETWV